LKDTVLDWEVSVENWQTPHTLGRGGDLSLYKPHRLGLQETQYKHNTNSIYLTPARSRSGSLTDSKTGPKISKQLYRKTLSHDVSKLM